MDEPVDVVELVKAFPDFFNRFSYLEKELVAEILQNVDFDEEEAADQLKNFNASCSGTEASQSITQADKAEKSDNSDNDLELSISQGKRKRMEPDSGEIKARTTRSTNSIIFSSTPTPTPTPNPKKAKIADLAPVKLKYISKEPELTEDDKLEIIGENTSDLADEDLPCRNLDNFVIYDEKRGDKMVPLYDYLRKGSSIIASGDVTAQGMENYEDLDVGDDDEDDAFNEEPTTQRFGQRVKLSSIYYFQDDEDTIESGSPRIWLRTSYAFYRLLRPAPEYELIFRKLFIVYKAKSAIIANVIQNVEITWEEFLRCMNTPLTVKYGEQSGSSASGSTQTPASSSSTDTVLPMYEYDLTEKDICSNIAEIVQEVEDFMDLHKWESFSPLILTLYELCQGKKSTTRKPTRERSDVKVKDVNKFVLQKRNMSTITPLIAKIAAGLFKRNVVKVEGTLKTDNQMKEENDVDEQFEVLKISANGDVTVDENSPNNDNKLTTSAKAKLKPISKKITESTVFVDPSTGSNKLNSLKSRVYYNKCIIDGEYITVGDAIYVRKPTDETDPNEPWFFKVCYFFMETTKCGNKLKGKKMVHARWLSHGKESILEEVAGYNELFLTDDCMDLPLKSIVGKCDLSWLEPGQPEPDWGNEQKFFYRMFYDKDQGSFDDAKKYELTPNSISKILNNAEELNLYPYDNDDFPDCCNKHEWCAGCNRKIIQKRQMDPSWAVLKNKSSTRDLEFSHSLYNAFEYKREAYTVGDFVYIVPETTNTPYIIGHIEKIHDKSPKNGTIKTLKSWLGQDSDDEVEINDKNKRKVVSNVDNLNEKTIWVTVRVFKRYTEVLKEFDRIERAKMGIDDPLEVPSFKTRDIRCLLPTKESIIVNARKLEGICWVQHLQQIFKQANAKTEQEKKKALDDFKDEDINAFWYNEFLAGTGKAGNELRFDIRKFVDKAQADEQNYEEDKAVSVELMPYLEVNPIRERQRTARIRERKDFLKSLKKVRALDIFSGCGGLSCGLEMSGAVETTNAVEFSASAAVTFRHNFPDSSVHNFCANTLLARVIDPSSQKIVKDHSKEILLDLPLKDSERSPEFIYGGPPWILWNKSI
ncbi:hypothetical protein HK096_003215 [Nowakowskiella sp. JEL0078]|nr:hypothetical protein HK096_003215 [Nowakowskiella sp. JEL0078]